MSDGIGQIRQHLNRVLARQVRPLFLVVDADMVLREWHGKGERFGLGGLTAGQSLQHELAMLATLDADDAEPWSWRFVQLPTGHVCHVHLIRLPSGWGVALLDASAEHAEQQARQQAAHELLLLRNERERLIEQLEEANALKGSFIAKMSHEFRTPLTSVIGYSDRLRELRSDDREVQQHLAAVNRGARHLLNLVENLLDQARIEMDQLQLNPSACELHDMSDEIEQLLRPVAQQKQLALAWWLDGEIPPRLWLDATRLKQVLINLVGNAIKFTQQGGVNVEFDWQDERLHVSVTDTGPGIAAEDIAAIFEPFRQGDGIHQGKGAGLGLSISQALVRAMGGEITVSSRKGEGSRFEFTIDAAGVKGGKAAGGGNLSGHKVLVADDDPDLLELFRLYLSAAGCKTQLARDAAAALDGSRRFAPDVVLLDLNLGDGNGLEVASRIRDAGYRKPIVLLSATAPGDDASAPETTADIDARWVKPISRAKLLEGLAALIGRNRAAGAL